MKRYTFVIQIHPEGISTLENLSTQERIQIPELSMVGQQIESWLATAPGEVRSAQVSSEPGPSGSPPE